MILSLIVAHDLQRAIGLRQQLPWHLPADLHYFKQRTMGHCLIMGSRSYEAIGRPLPGRTTLVLSRRPDYEAPGAVVLPRIEAAVEYAFKLGDTEPFVAGGGQVYAQALPMVHRLYVSEVQTTVSEADTFFPPLDTTVWNLVSERLRPADERNAHDIWFRVYERV